jgi:three-Cys-motif partner protein
MMDRSQLPPYAAHHAAKHALLREYMNAWLPKLGFSHPQVAIVDGFASAGRYRDGQRGSPLIALDAYLGRSASDRARFKRPPEFIFIESKRRFVEHLQDEINAIGDLKGARVEVISGRYEVEFPKVIDRLARTYGRLPAFAFVDPRGYSETPFELIRSYRRALGEKAEAMIYLPVNFMARFVETELTEGALRRALGGADAIERVRQNPDAVDREAGERIADEFAELMRKEYDFVTQFTIDPVRHNEYHLFFGTGSEHGVREMKRAYWKVDPVGGSGYQQDARQALGQGALFGPAELRRLPDEDTLPVLLREHYLTRVFDVQDAERFTLLQTRFLDKPHLRQWALRPLEKAGELEVVESPRRRASDYPAGTLARFTR